jgi:ABC-2 type transport system ATP-binding protein
MAERAFEKVRDLNGGHRRRMEIARALIHRPDILLLDEPTVGLDAQSRHTITRDLHAMARDGISVLWATHLVDEISDNDRVLVFHDGQIRADGTGRALRNGRPLLESFLDMTSTLEATS